MKNPYLSPVYGNFNGLALKLVASDKEQLAGDAKALYEKAANDGAEIEYELFDGCFHAFPEIGNATE